MTYLKAQTRNFPSKVRKQTSIATQETIDKSGSEQCAKGSEAEKCHAMHLPALRITRETVYCEEPSS
ncbi:hypothetical protein BHYA_0230g00180 [Botrytis hyacinthi]|uniref:Uncharacterized protein n=1 Tax=Botrytis hyacinthi TaxID=278943 RepID=A0A4Z1GE89_9HELO|nr:hypothetical protein BHYA_0230g00180 [Botrytis hyacinthi]